MLSTADHLSGPRSLNTGFSENPSGPGSGIWSFNRTHVRQRRRNRHHHHFFFASSLTNEILFGFFWFRFLPEELESGACLTEGGGLWTGLSVAREPVWN